MNRTALIALCAAACVVFINGGRLLAQEKAKPAPQPAAKAAQPAPQAAKPAQVAPGFASADAWNKIDPDLQQAYKDAMAAGDKQRRFDCFVRDQDPLDIGDQSFLQSKGFNVRAVGGRVATGYLMAQDLPDVAALPFVANIKLSKQP